MIDGAHVVIYSEDAAADRDFFRDVLGLPSVDAGGGWLVFALPPAEAAFHPADRAAAHELFLTCDDLVATMEELTARGARFASPVTEERWGSRTSLALPGGGEVGLYQPRHPRP